jgi:hypothetical protein
MALQATQEILLSKFKKVEERISALEKGREEDAKLREEMQSRIEELQRKVTQLESQLAEAEGKGKGRGRSDTGSSLTSSSSSIKEAPAPSNDRRRPSMVHLHRAALEARLTAGVQAPMTSSERIAALGLDDLKSDGTNGSSIAAKRASFDRRGSRSSVSSSSSKTD